MSDSARDRFVRLANARVNRALKDIQLIGNLSNKSNYQYTERDIERIFKALNDELKACRGNQVGLPVVRCSEYQLKIGPWSYYTKGTFHHDGNPSRRGAGFLAFKVAVEVWLEEEGLSEAVKR